jgi:Lsr2
VNSNVQVGDCLTRPALTPGRGLRVIDCMAKTTTVTVTDDIDGSANAETIELSYKGTAYTIDLSKKNVTALERLLSLTSLLRRRFLLAVGPCRHLLVAVVEQ